MLTALLPPLGKPPTEERLPCHGRSAEWEDPDPMAKLRAKAACYGCPARDWCTQLAADARAAQLDLEGVWHGVDYS